MVLCPNAGTHDLAIKLMFLDHDNIDCLGVLESEEAKSAGTSGGAIPHHRTFDDLAKLREIVAQ